MAMRRGMLAVVLILFAATAAYAQEGPRAMTVDDAMDMKSVGSALISPDGNWVFYSESQLEWDKNRRQTKYYMIPATGGEPFQYIGEDGGSGFQFSPDGQYFTFTRTVEEKRQIFLMRTAGGEAVQLTKHETSVGSYKWSADSKKIFFSAQDKRPEEEEKALKDKADAIFVDEGPNGQNRSYWSNLWVFDLDSKKETRITNEKFLLSGFDVSPDGKRVLFSARYTNRRNDGYKNEIYMITVGDSVKVRLTENNAPEGGMVWSPDGRRFAYSAADDKEWMNRNSKIWIMNPDTKEYRMLSGDFEGSPGGFVWTPDGRYLLFSGQQGANSYLFRMNARSGDFEKLTDMPGSLRASSFTRDRTKFVYSFTDFDTPGDIYVSEVNDFDPVKLTDANPGFADKFLLSSMKLVQWESVKGYEIEGLLHLPPGYKEGDRVPLMLNIHGGPAGAFTNGFRASYHMYGGLGYASLSPNVRGSSGYTDHLREGNTVQAGDGIGFGDYWDLMNGVDLLIREGIVDEDHRGLLGWSYGGNLGGWTITQTDRFKAASIGAGVYDWTSEYGPGFNHDVRLWHIGGTPWDNPEGWRNQSALTHAKNVVTPTILLHGDNDQTDTEQQSMMYFTAIKDIGKAPVRYIKFPRQGHGIGEPRLQRIRDIEEIRWMQKYVMGEEWTPWERPKSEAEKEKEKEK
jgi:dipeptidyl aminopeptidase/acylaminoacyl peptidase